ncbi:hypothetical protein ACSSZE_03425 [Acidithiobacillus caldus]
MKEQVFHDVEDFLDLDEQAFQRMLPDLVEWHRLSREATLQFRKIDATEEWKVAGFIWIDDGNPGNCKGVSVKTDVPRVTGDKKLYITISDCCVWEDQYNREEHGKVVYTLYPGDRLPDNWFGETHG